jgi:hypothetical protein
MLEKGLEMRTLVARIRTGRRYLEKLTFNQGLVKLVGELQVQRLKGQAAACPWQVQSSSAASESLD